MIRYYTETVHEILIYTDIVFILVQLFLHNNVQDFQSLYFYVQADTTDIEYREGSGGTYGELMNFLEEPGVRQRAQSIASVITSTMEGMYSTQ